MAFTILQSANNPNAVIITTETGQADSYEKNELRARLLAGAVGVDIVLESAGQTIYSGLTYTQVTNPSVGSNALLFAALDALFFLTEGSYQVLGAAGAVDLTKHTTLLQVPAGPAPTNHTMAAGTEGLVHEFQLDSLGAAGAAIITVTNGRGFTTLNFQATLDYGITLRYVNGEWGIIGGHGVTPA